MLPRLTLETEKTVAGSQAGTTASFDLEQCRKFSVLIKPNAAHTFSAKVNWAADICSGAGKVQDTAISSANQGNVVSAVIESKADIAAIEITNGDTSEHTYAVYIHRVE